MAKNNTYTAKITDFPQQEIEVDRETGEVNDISDKEKVSLCVENIFKRYIKPGIEICDLATGGGKSYTISKLTCDYYPDYFDRIVILCVQNKLIDGIKNELGKLIKSLHSKITESDILVITTNTEVITTAINSGNFEDLINEIDNQIDILKRKLKSIKDHKESPIRELEYFQKEIIKTYNVISKLLKLSIKETFDTLEDQIRDNEQKLRINVRMFFNKYKNILEKSGQVKKVTLARILNDFPSLVKVYPQVDYKRKKLLIMSVHKAMYGIDPILFDKIYLEDLPLGCNPRRNEELSKEPKKTLIIFDESDQAVDAMRQSIIDQSLKNEGGNTKPSYIYSDYLQYESLIDNPEFLSDLYHGSLIDDCIKTARKITNKNWKNSFQDIPRYKNIFLDDKSEIESFRRAVFFAGPTLKLNISPKKNKLYSYICYKENERHFRLVRTKDINKLNKNYKIYMSIKRFLTLVKNNTTVIKGQFRKVITERLEESISMFEKEIKSIAQNISTEQLFLSYPTLQSENHTLFSRFEIASEKYFEKLQLDYMKNRKNISIKKDKKEMKFPDNSVYFQGFQLFQEEIDEKDHQRRVRISYRELTTTSEKILINLASKPGTTIVLSSATAANQSVVSNCDIQKIKDILGDRVRFLPSEIYEEFDRLVALTYPKEHKISVMGIEHYVYNDQSETAIILPEKYKNMFSLDAINSGQADEWFKVTLRILKKTSKDYENIMFELYRLYQFIEVYRHFITHDDIHSMLYFQNRSGIKDKLQIMTLSCLIDGSYKRYPLIDGELPRNWENPNIRISKDWREIESEILPELASNKDAKIMLITAYGSFKAGVNMQYHIPEALDFISGDNWTTGRKEMKKDWDAIYLQSPTGYLMVETDSHENPKENSLHYIILVLSMLYERGCLSLGELRYWILCAISNNFMFGDNNNDGIKKDKNAWAQTIIEQAVGRLCRTRNKPKTTYIFYDESMSGFFDKSNMKKSLTKEFKALADHIFKSSKENQVNPDTEETIRVNQANYVQRQLDRILSLALSYYPHPNEPENLEEEESQEEGLAHGVFESQFQNQQFKQILLRKPVIKNLDDINQESKCIPFLSKCYGNWKVNENQQFVYYRDKEDSKKLATSSNGVRHLISPSTVRLDVLMKNKTIKKYFQENGYATEWQAQGLIVHPQILETFYAGEIGEEAFLAILLEYTGLRKSEIVHLERRDYELADFAILNPDGTYRIAFDIKNMNPNSLHYDKPGELSTTEKRMTKKERLKCEIITVNMVKIDGVQLDSLHEITGLLDSEGNIIPEAIEILRKLVKPE